MSWKSAIEPIISRFPTVERPEGHVPFRQKMKWTALVLVLYFFLTNVTLLGLGTGGQDAFGQFRSLLAGGQGTILQLGIGPIVTGSIVLQLLTGAGLISIDKQDPRDQAIYQGLQKMLVMLFIFIQAIPIVFMSGFLPVNTGLASRLGIGVLGVQMLMFVQVLAGGVLIYFMDEVVSKWGVGSGVGLFIIAGISQQIIGGLISIPNIIGNQWGIIPAWVSIAVGSLPLSVDTLLYGPGQLIALGTTVIIFATVVFAESVRVEVPIKHAQTSGAQGRYPVKLIYASVLPVILIRALQANIQIMGRVINRILGDSMPVWLGVYSDGQPINGLFYLLSPIQEPIWAAAVGQPMWLMALRVVVDLVFMVGGSALFAIFWVETADMDPKTVANQLRNSGMQIPGFRQNTQSFERVLERYIPQVTVIGGALVGLLAVVANMLGTIGGVSGTGLLLTVSITYKLYEEIAEEKLKDMHPMVRKMME